MADTTHISATLHSRARAALDARYTRAGRGRQPLSRSEAVGWGLVAVEALSTHVAMPALSDTTWSALEDYVRDVGVSLWEGAGLARTLDRLETLVVLGDDPDDDEAIEASAAIVADIRRLDHVQRIVALDEARRRASDVA